MNPAHLPRIEALRALPLAARKLLWLTEVPGWCFWLDGVECRACEGEDHTRCLDCDSYSQEYHPHCSCQTWGDKELSWPCTEPRCSPCAGTGWFTPEWTTDGLGLGGGMVALWQHKIIRGVLPDDAWFDGHLWLPYSPTDVLALAAKVIGDARWTLDVRVYDTAIEATVWERGGGGAWTATNDDPLLAALDVLAQVAPERPPS